MRAVVYVAVALALIAFGALAVFSIGAPFLLTGVAMLAVLPWRHRADVMWPAVLAPWAFALGYVLVAPLGCSSTVGAATGEAPGESFTTCTNVIGIDYSGSGSYAPPLGPAVAAGLVFASIAAYTVRRALRRSG
jgi:hypothetical protein